MREVGVDILGGKLGVASREGRRSRSPMARLLGGREDDGFGPSPAAGSGAQAAIKRDHWMASSYCVVSLLCRTVSLPCRFESERNNLRCGHKDPVPCLLMCSCSQICDFAPCRPGVVGPADCGTLRIDINLATSLGGQIFGCHANRHGLYRLSAHLFSLRGTL